MDLIKALQELRLEREDISAAIDSLENFEARQHHGRMPVKKLGRPRGSKKKTTAGWSGLLTVLSAKAAVSS